LNINATLLGQAITFAILIWFTMKFVWPPLLQAMEERAKTIADGLPLLNVASSAAAALAVDLVETHGVALVALHELASLNGRSPFGRVEIQNVAVFPDARRARRQSNIVTSNLPSADTQPARPW